MDPRDYVLHDFDPPDSTFLPELMGRAVDAILCYVQDGIEKAMNDFNGSLITEE
jgi:peptidyl-tRNA hydrolase